MADNIARIRIDTTEYDAKLKKASEALTRYFDTVKQGEGTLEVLDDGVLEAIQALGKMETVATSSKAKLREYTDAITSLTSQYRQLTDAEKSGDVGKALSASLGEMKSRAAELKDTMSDVNREITNLSSDTRFTDGMSAMTRTIGSVATAVTALTGKSENMQKVLMDIAKIESTVRAVDTLTKSFQKQNLVLLKNPYVLVAAGIAALGTAIYEYVNKADGAIKTTEDYAASIDKLGSAAEIAKYKIADLINIKVNESRISDLTDSFNKAFQERAKAEKRLSQIDGGTEWFEGSWYGADKLREVLNERIARANVSMTNDQALIKLYSGQNAGINKAYEPTRTTSQTPRGRGGATGAGREFESALKFDDLAVATLGTTQSMAELQEQLREYKQALANATNAYDYGEAQAGIARTERQMAVQPLAIQAGVDWESMEAVQQEMNSFIDEVKSGMKPLEIPVPKLGKDMEDATDAMTKAAHAASSIGSALSSIEDPAAKVMGIIAEAIATIALTFAKSLKGTFTPWDWIAAAAAGTATMVSTIVAIKQATAGSYAEGGIVPGNRWSGDNLTANVNAGELILSRAAQGNIASQLTQGAGAPTSTRATISGEQIILAVNAYGRRTGRGELIRI